MGLHISITPNLRLQTEQEKAKHEAQLKVDQTASTSGSKEITLNHQSLLREYIKHTGKGCAVAIATHPFDGR